MPAARRPLPGGIPLFCWLAAAGCGGQVLLGTAEDDAGGWEADSAAEVDPAAWLDVVGEVGETGWRDSTMPWVPSCAEGPRPPGLSATVWSFPGAVYVLGSWSPRDGTSERTVLYEVQVNRGDGWTIFTSGDCTDFGLPAELGPMNCVEDLQGVALDTLLVWPYLAWLRPESLQRDDLIIGDAFVVREDLVYALSGHGAQPVLRYDGTSWGPVGAVFPSDVNLADIWADETRVVVTGDSGTLHVLEGSEWSQWETGTLNDLSTVWGFSDGEIWTVTVGWTVAESAHLLRCRDGRCEEMAWPRNGVDDPCGAGPIKSMWGSDGNLFFADEHQLVQWDGARFRQLGYWPATYAPDPTHDDCRAGGLWIRSLWGNSPTEVFLLVDALGNHEGSCAAYHLLRWDGSEFHWL